MCVRAAVAIIAACGISRPRSTCDIIELSIIFASCGRNVVGVESRKIDCGQLGN